MRLRSKISRFQNFPVSVTERLVNRNTGGNTGRTGRRFFRWFLRFSLFVEFDLVINLHRQSFGVEFTAVHNLAHRLWCFRLKFVFRRRRYTFHPKMNFSQLLDKFKQKTISRNSSIKYLEHQTDIYGSKLIHPDQKWYIWIENDTCESKMIHVDQKRYIWIKKDTYGSKMMHMNQKWWIKIENDAFGSKIIHMDQKW